MRPYATPLLVSCPYLASAVTAVNSDLLGASNSSSDEAWDRQCDDAARTWSVSWGDFTLAAKGTTSVQGDVGQFSHAYAKPGTFGAYLKVVDKDGGASLVKKVTVTVVQPAQ